MIDRKQGHIDRAILTPLIKAMEIIEPITRVEIKGHKPIEILSPSVLLESEE